MKLDDTNVQLYPFFKNPHTLLQIVLDVYLQIYIPAKKHDNYTMYNQKKYRII